MRMAPPCEGPQVDPYTGDTRCPRGCEPEDGVAWVDYCDACMTAYDAQVDREVEARYEQ